LCRQSILFYEREGKTADRYESKDFWESRYHRERMKAIWSILRGLMKPADIFLDAGCGTGEYLLLVNRVPNVDAYGVDVSTSYLRRARASGTQVIRADVLHLPFRDAVFQVVLCSEVLEHIAAPMAAARELFRTAHRCVIVSSPNFGVLRFITRIIFPGLVDQLDRSVGHVSIEKIGRLSKELVGGRWRLKLRRTLHVAPPYLSRLRIPPSFARPTYLAEKALEAFLPLLGNVSILVFGASPEQDL